MELLTEFERIANEARVLMSSRAGELPLSELDRVLAIIRSCEEGKRTYGDLVRRLETARQQLSFATVTAPALLDGMSGGNGLAATYDPPSRSQQAGASVRPANSGYREERGGNHFSTGSPITDADLAPMRSES
jgi:hypothetical protein